MIEGIFKHARYGRTMRFLFAGGIATITDFALVYALTDLLGVWYLASATIAFCLAVVVSFTLQKFWTFQNVDLASVNTQFFRFVVIAVAGLSINTSVMYTLVEFAGLHYLFAKIIASGLVAFMNYFAYKFIVFER